MPGSAADSTSSSAQSPGLDRSLISDLLFDSRPTGDVANVASEAIRLLIVELVERSASLARENDESSVNARHVAEALPELLFDVL